MTVGATPVNTGLITRNQAVIETANKKLLGKSAKDLQANATGSLRELSEEEVRELHAKAKNETKVLQADRSEFINNIYSKTGDNITYEIDGVRFTNEEMKRCKELVKQAVMELPSMGSDLDYEDYAAIGLAENMVSTYAKEHLTEEQANVLEQSISDYMEQLIDAEKERQSGEGYFIDQQDSVGPTGELNNYYAMRKTLGESAAESFKKLLNEKLPEQTRHTLLANLEHAQTSGSVVQSATNRELAGMIRELFKNTDMKNPSAMSSACNKYKELMKPVYQSFGVMDTAQHNSLTHVLNQDVNRFDMQAARAKAVMGGLGGTVNVSV
ncbi:MAG: hypothetical protein J6K04_08560 [Lachnospiraceae bacterium]|nr:hypothetical protein [Lachnospiraceae bacterium]